jgi:hypothetical protein
MIFRQNAFFLLTTAVSPTVLAHQLAELIPGVPQDSMLILKMVTFLMGMAFGDSVELIAPLIHMMVWFLCFFLSLAYFSIAKVCTKIDKVLFIPKFVGS